ncbi:DUF5318 family protein [Nonomuraea sp. NPDC046570]|uniref:DUF5318 family protein n=1 Tax=Nonomuraea sp. NPDC046570 TaxID=3155255 RepID=UPI003401214E
MQLMTLPRGWGQSVKSRSLAPMWSQRRVVDYGLGRRAVAHSLSRGFLHADGLCPVCERENVTNVAYVHGDSPGRHAGRVKATSELILMAHDYCGRGVPRLGWEPPDALARPRQRTMRPPPVARENEEGDWPPTPTRRAIRRRCEDV